MPNDTIKNLIFVDCEGHGPAPTFEKAVDLYEKGKVTQFKEGIAAKIVSELPVSEQTAKLLVDTLLRLDDKLGRGGVDDSDGTVGGFIEETVQALEEYAKFDSNCAKAFKELKDKETCFGWERPLLKLIH